MRANGASQEVGSGGGGAGIAREKVARRFVRLANKGTGGKRIGKLGERSCCTFLRIQRSLPGICFLVQLAPGWPLILRARPTPVGKKSASTSAPLPLPRLSTLPCVSVVQCESFAPGSRKKRSERAGPGRPCPAILCWFLLQFRPRLLDRRRAVVACLCALEDPQPGTAGDTPQNVVQIGGLSDNGRNSIFACFRRVHQRRGEKPSSHATGGCSPISPTTRRSKDLECGGAASGGSRNE